MTDIIKDDLAIYKGVVGHLWSYFICCVRNT